MTKTEAVLANKRASNRLKPLADTVMQLAIGRVARPIAKEKQLLCARLDRELTEEDDEAQSLCIAVDTFWKAYDSEDDKDTLMPVRRTWSVSSKRSSQHGGCVSRRSTGRLPTTLMGFGQVKPQYSQRSVQKKKPVPRKPSWLHRLKKWLAMLK